MSLINILHIFALEARGRFQQPARGFFQLINLSPHPLINFPKISAHPAGARLRNARPFMNSRDALFPGYWYHTLRMIIMRLFPLHFFCYILTFIVRLALTVASVELAQKNEAIPDARNARSGILCFLAPWWNGPFYRRSLSGFRPYWPGTSLNVSSAMISCIFMGGKIIVKPFSVKKNRIKENYQAVRNFILPFKVHTFVANEDNKAISNLLR